ncbi:hypothetical protein [Methylobacterium nodulans]|nr:hypothetical protein [Methylobacterium nodulans]
MSPPHADSAKPVKLDVALVLELRLSARWELPLRMARYPHMSTHPGRSADEWAGIIAEAYAAETRPPLTRHLREEVRVIVAEALREAEAADSPDAEWCERVNLVLDRSEMSLHAAVGPRLAAIDDAAGSAVMVHRSEAGRPLRPFGGQ